MVRFYFGDLVQLFFCMQLFFSVHCILSVCVDIFNFISHKYNLTIFSVSAETLEMVSCDYVK